jgi:alanine racemase
MRSTRAVIHLAALRHNIEEIRKLLAPGVRLCVPVKADAYGHGAVPCARQSVESGADCLGVATVPEGTELRAAGIRQPILLFGPAGPDEIPELAAGTLSPFVFDIGAIALLEKEAARQDKTISVHLKVDTGMGRIGCKPEEAASTARFISRCGHLRLEGMCTHFAASDSLHDDDRAFTHEQFRRFTAAIARVKAAGIDPGLCHCANSGAVLAYPQTRLDMARPGIMAYGYYPGEYRNGRPVLAEQFPINLEPVMDLETQISAVKEVPAGASISYGRRWTSGMPARIATLPIGYADGLCRRLSPAGLQVAVGGQSCPVRGTICMDQCMIEITAVPEARAGDLAIVFGSSKRGAFHDAGAVAELAGTIPYEILTSISKRVPRIYGE